jgi:hypothetical protein
VEVGNVNNTELVIMKKFKFILCAFLPLMAMCHPDSETNTKYHPQDIFEKYLFNPIPETSRAFDAKITTISPTEYTIWVAFDCSSDDWELIQSKLVIVRGPSMNLKFISGRTPNDTGFEGYLDDDFTPFSDTKKRMYFVRKTKAGYRIVFFWRQA